MELGNTFYQFRGPQKRNAFFLICQKDILRAGTMSTSLSGGRSPSMRHRICLVSDFFFPNFGGVETHIWCLAQCLMQRGHKVIVVTHAYGSRTGIRVMTNGLKVYYLPIQPVYDQVIFPTIFGLFPTLRNILLRERISLVHGHQSVSPLAHASLLIARTLGLRTCFTEHSLFPFNDVASIHINKLLEVTLSDVDHVICVSHTCRENLCLRAKLHPNMVSAIPNAVDCRQFTPAPPSSTPAPTPTISSISNTTNAASTVTIVVLSRLVYRKGIDLLVQVIPEVCARLSAASAAASTAAATASTSTTPSSSSSSSSATAASPAATREVRFLIGGDGPKRLLLEEMRERYQLHDRVELLGAVPTDEVQDVLRQGQVFLNCSLTESFCIALLEAAACGLFIVSTQVGGVPEVLPPSMLRFADAQVPALVDAVVEAVSLCQRVDPADVHDRVAHMYSWQEVARRVEGVYTAVCSGPRRHATLGKRLSRHATAGAAAGPLAVLVVVLLELWRMLWDHVLLPVREIEIAPDVFFSTEEPLSR